MSFTTPCGCCNVSVASLLSVIAMLCEPTGLNISLLSWMRYAARHKVPSCAACFDQFSSGSILNGASISMDCTPDSSNTPGADSLVSACRMSPPQRPTIGALAGSTTRSNTYSSPTAFSNKRLTGPVCPVPSNSRCGACERYPVKTAEPSFLRSSTRAPSVGAVRSFAPVSHTCIPDA